MPLQFSLFYTQPEKSFVKYFVPTYKKSAKRILSYLRFKKNIKMRSKLKFKKVKNTFSDCAMKLWRGNHISQSQRLMWLPSMWRGNHKVLSDSDNKQNFFLQINREKILFEFAPGLFIWINWKNLSRKQVSGFLYG